MRVQLSRCAALVGAGGALAGLAWAAVTARSARADGEIALRGAYYKERATRVQQPMVDAHFDVGTSGQIDTYFLVDAITSASVAAGMDGSSFREIRYENGTTYQHTLDRFKIGGGYRVSSEPDYSSALVNLRGAVELGERNTVLAASLSRGIDDISDNNRTGLAQPLEAQLTTTMTSVSVSQVLSRVAVASVTYDLSYLDGYQENPYRQVIAGGTRLGESVPDTRLRHALFVGVRGFIEPTASTVIVGYRYYRDDWGVRAHTPELRIVQPVVRDVEARVRYRYYSQSAADFYKETYDQVEEHMTDDPKLGSYTTHTTGLQLAVALARFGVCGSMARARIELTGDYLVQSNRFGNAVVGQLAIALPLEY